VREVLRGYGDRGTRRMGVGSGGLAVWSLLRKVLEVVRGSGGGANREVNHSSGRIS